MDKADFERTINYEKMLAELEKMRADAEKSREDAAKARVESTKIEKETHYYPTIMIMLAFTTSLVALVVALLK